MIQKLLAAFFKQVKCSVWKFPSSENLYMILINYGYRIKNKSAWKKKKHLFCK